MAALLDESTHFLEARDVPLIEKRRLDDGTELVFEPQNDENGLCLIRVFRLPAGEMIIDGE